VSEPASDNPAPRPKIISFIPPPGDWRKDLLCYDGSLKPRPNTANACHALTHAPEWTGVLGYDEFQDRILIGEAPPWGGAGNRAWTVADETATDSWFCAQGMDMRTATVRAAVHFAARQHRRNSLQEHLASLQWDGTGRVFDWLSIYLGAEDTPLIRSIGRCWLVSAVARAYQPGCQADHCLILEGEQGIRKSTALRTLARPEFFAEHVAQSLNDKESAMLLRGAWIVEFSELENLKKNSHERVKSFMTRRTDHYVRKYENVPIDVERSCVFCGTTNQENYLTDETGGRRFWPVRCRFAATQKLEEDRDQIWAEAVTLYRAGEAWHLSSAAEAAAAGEQAKRLDDEPWMEPILRYLEGREEVRVNEILTDKFGRHIYELTRADQNRVGCCLRRLGWLRTTDSNGRRSWHRPPEQSHKARLTRTRDY